MYRSRWTLVSTAVVFLVAALIPTSRSADLSELRDFDRVAHGNAAVYSLQDCSLFFSGPNTGNFLVQGDDSPEYDVRYGLLSVLRADRNFYGCSCVGHFTDSPFTISLPDPPSSDGYYFLIRGFSSCPTFGDSTLTPDPRDVLDEISSICF